MITKKLVFFGLLVGVLGVLILGCCPLHRETAYQPAVAVAAEPAPAPVAQLPACGAPDDRAIAERMAAPLPPARPGECYARVYIPPQCETVTERVVVREASERIETIPASYETVEERVMVKSASKRLEEVPAKYDWVEDKVLVEPAHTEWRHGRGEVEKIDSATGEILCLVEVPASYKTVRRQVVSEAATVREVEVPAEYQTIKVTKMVSPPQEKRIQIPAEYENVTMTKKVSDGRMEWKQVTCEPDKGFTSK
jgi:hypothetical protein